MLVNFDGGKHILALMESGCSGVGCEIKRQKENLRSNSSKYLEGHKQQSEHERLGLCILPYLVGHKQQSEHEKLGVYILFGLQKLPT